MSGGYDVRVKILKKWLEAHAARWLEWEVYFALRLNHAAAIAVLLNVLVFTASLLYLSSPCY